MTKTNKKNRNKKLKKEYDRRRNFVLISLNSSESSLLEIEMKKCEATVKSSFIKYKLFGLDSEDKFQRTLSNVTSESDIKTIIEKEVKELNNAIDYINIRFNREIEAFQADFAGADDKRAINKRVAIMNDWQQSLQNKTDKIFLDLQILLERMDIIVERKKQEEVRTMPQSILDEYVKNWNDTTSPEIYEAGRRMLERTKNKNDKK